MKKRNVKVHFGNLILVIFVIGIFAYGGFYVYKNFLSDEENVGSNPVESNNKVDSKVNKKLKELGYSNSDIEIIEKNLSSDVIDKIEEKYDD